jgi:nucleotide-binding universal stress UspA family protein
MNNRLPSFIRAFDAMRVLVATDLNARSDAALRRAIVLAKSIGAALTVVHAIPKTQSKAKSRIQKSLAYAQILSAVDEAIVGQRLELVDIDVRVGKPIEAIAASARDSNADLIVIASPEPRRFDAIVGTTAERLIRVSRRPVLIVHRDAAEDYRSATVATDLSTGSASMLQTAVRLGVLDRANTTLLHAFDPPYSGMLSSAGVSAEEIKRYHQDVRDELEDVARGISMAAGVAARSVHMIAQRNQPAEVIRDVVERSQPDLLVIGASRWFLTKRLLLGSVADELLRNAPCDVLVIPRRFEKAYMSRVRRTQRQLAAPDRRQSSDAAAAGRETADA